MANEYTFEIEAQPFWGGRKPSRFQRVYFSLPDDEVILANGAPRICMLFSGFAGNATKNVYKKMRNTFADKYNYVMIQCDYFGYEFMDENDARDELEDYINEIQNTFTNERWMDVLKNDIALERESEVCKVENRDNFCEMGLFQAMDCLRALKSVMQLLDSISLAYDPVILTYGISQGAYLSYMINAFYPNLISNIIDNSAWLFPNYFVNPLAFWKTFSIENPENGELVDKDVVVYRRFHAMEYIDDIDIYYLPLLYMQFDNHARIIAFHGIDDYMIKYEDKMEFLRKIRNADCNIVDKASVDGIIFSSVEHGLGADFLKLFDYVMENEQLMINPNLDNMWESNIFKTLEYRYWCTIENNMPTIHREKIK